MNARPFGCLCSRAAAQDCGPPGDDRNRLQVRTHAPLTRPHHAQASGWLPAPQLIHNHRLSARRLHTRLPFVPHPVPDVCIPTLPVAAFCLRMEFCAPHSS